MADVSSTLPAWSTTAASNSPSGSTTIGTGLDDNLREIQAVVRAWLANKGADIASATTTDIGAVAGYAHDITGTTTITGLGTIGAGIVKVLQFDGALTFTHNSTSLILPGGANITTAAGDVAMMASEGSGNWRCVFYSKASGAPVKIAANSIDGTMIALGSDAQGDVMYYDGTNWARLGAGTSGQFLKTQGAGANPVWADGGGITLGTAQASTSGSAINFTSIPSGTKRITVMLDGVSTNGTADLLVQIGDSGGLETTGYVSQVSDGGTPSTSTSGFSCVDGVVAAALYYGSVVLTLMDASTNTWIASVETTRDVGTAHVNNGSGRKALTGTLDRVSVVTTDTLDAGTINIAYES